MPSTGSRLQLYHDASVTLTNSPARMFLFDTRGQRLYYRQSVTVLREGRRIATATVNRRFTAQNAAAAEIIEAVEEVKTGDAVVAQSGDAAP